MTSDTTSDKLIATTRMSKTGATTAKTTQKKVVRKTTTKKVVASKSEPRPAKPEQAANKPANAPIGGPDSSHGAGIQHGQRIWPD